MPGNFASLMNTPPKPQVMTENTMAASAMAVRRAADMSLVVAASTTRCSHSASIPCSWEPPRRMAACMGTDYLEEVEEWRRGRLERLTAPEGWLSLAGLWWLHEGSNP